MSPKAKYTKEMIVKFAKSIPYLKRNIFKYKENYTQ